MFVDEAPSRQRMSLMGSTVEDKDARNAKRASRTTPSADVDLISGLDDDLLLRVLALMPDGRDAARAAVLSRRWLGLWRRVPTLRFTSPRVSSAAGPCAAFERSVSFVNSILARRMQSDCPIESLEISYTMDSEHNLKRLMLASVDAVQGWIRYAFLHGLKSFIVDLDLRDDDYEEEDDDKGCENEPEVCLDELPSPVRLETIRLALGNARLRLPNTMKFASVTDLSLERIEIADGSGARLLARLVSSASCPRLQKLRMNKLWFLDSSEELRLEANMLSELWVEDVNVPMSLELKTPSLRIFHIDTCYSCDNNGVLRVSAPRLEELAFFQRGCPPGLLEVDGDLSCMRSLKICLWSHARVSGYGQAQNNVNMLLLKQCSSLTCLDVTLKGRKVRLSQNSNKYHCSVHV
ncbi:unnamed protein product [Urochloa decumbens]|uniref:F-box domain-containing protein n=1 Tax=Urochloa decumbens TaxID=240449 RepID=A0ABC9DW33_9POAL